MSNEVVQVKQAVWGLAQRATRLQAKLMGITQSSERNTQAVLDVASTAWTGTGTTPDEPFIQMPIDTGARIPGKRRNPAQIWFVAGTLPGRAAAQLLLARPNETVVALSQNATSAEIIAAVRHLRQVVPTWTHAGDGSSFPKKASAARADFHLPRPGWQVTLTAVEQAPEEAPPLLDTSTATVLTVPGPPIAETVIEQWLRFPHDAPDTFTALAERLAQTWTWAALDGLIDTLGYGAARLAQDPRADEDVYQRFLTEATPLGYAREAVLGQVRQRLLNKYACLPDRPLVSLWKRMGIKDIAFEEQDVLVVTAARARLRVELAPNWFAAGGPPVQGTTLTDRRLIEVNVAADPEGIDDELWDCVEQGLVRYPRSREPATIADLLRPNDNAADLATIHRLPGAYHRFDRAAQIAVWLSRHPHS